MRQRMNQTVVASQAALLAGGFIGLSAVNAAITPMAIAQSDLSAEHGKTTPKASDSLGSQIALGTGLSASVLVSTDATVAEPETFTPELSFSPSVSPIDLSTLSPEFAVSGDSVDDFGGTYIDPTEYSVGATQAPSVILSERSTGCQTVLEQGEVLSSSICSSTPSTVSLPGPVNAVRVGPLSVGPNGIRLVRSLNINDYYNRTERPNAFAGNGNTQLMFPLSIPAMVSSPFGWRVHPIFGNARLHTGTDLAAPMGTPVVATYSGRVTVADFLGGYGLTVVLRHDNRSIETLYGHLSELFVRPGDTIQQGEVIGRVGSTGNSTGPHLHFEVRQPTANGWVAVNSGDLLQEALGLAQNGLRLAEDHDDGSTDELLALNIPAFLQYGKDATKDNPDLQASSNPKTDSLSSALE